MASTEAVKESLKMIMLAGIPIRGVKAINEEVVAVYSSVCRNISDESLKKVAIKIIEKGLGDDLAMSVPILKKHITWDFRPESFVPESRRIENPKTTFAEYLAGLKERSLNLQKEIARFGDRDLPKTLEADRDKLAAELKGWRKVKSGDMNFLKMFEGIDFDLLPF